MRRFFTGCAILALALMASACDLRAEISVTDDGSGTMGMTFAMEPQFVQMAQQSGGDPFAEMSAPPAGPSVPSEDVAAFAATVPMDQISG